MVSRWFLLLLVGAATSAFGQCTKDTDCKGDRICTVGACSVPEAKSSRELKPKRRGWAGGAAVMGFVGGAAVLGTGLAAGAFAADDDKFYGTASVMLGTSGVLLALLGPLVAVGAASARIDPSITGSPGSRIAGWAVYGLTLASIIPGAILLSSKHSDEETVAPVLIGTAVGGLAALVLFSIDAVVSANQAKAFIDEPKRADGPLFLPGVSFAKTAGGTLIPTVGLTGSF